MSEREVRSHEEWCLLIDEQAGSGKTVAKFCESRELAEHSFYYHRRRRLERAGGFRQLRVVGASGIRVLTGGVEVQVDRGFDAGCLRAVVEALR